MSRLFLSLMLLSLLAGPVRAGDSAPIWPLDLPTRYLTSNFMEYRPGRFHAGLDLKTQTVTGFAAHAVEDGWIVRVRATPTAYGRAVYLRGASGRTYVYAHLSRFNDTLRARIKTARTRSGNYRTRLSFGPGEIPIKLGQVVGLTGQSGTGGPHLHFEVRDARNRPTDPQSLGFAVGDTMAPVIHQVRAWPVTPATTIDGQLGAHLLAGAAGLVGGQPGLRVTGPVAFSARIVDQADIRGHRLEPSLIEVWLDGERVYRCHNERFDFAQNAIERLEWVVLPGVREHWLHRSPADTLIGREGQLWYRGTAGLGLAVGSHQIRILAADQAGNQTEIHFEMIVEGENEGRRSPAGTAWLSDDVSPALASSDSLSFSKLTPFFEVESEVVSQERPDLVKYVFEPQAGDPVMTRLVVWSAVKALTADQKTAAAAQGLTPLAAGREFLAANWPLAASLPVSIEAPTLTAAATWGLYSWRSDHWEWEKSWQAGAQPGAEAEVTIDRPGLQAVLADNAAPVIEQPEPQSRIVPGPVSKVVGVTTPFWTVLPVGIREAGAGLASETIKVHLDGRLLIVEPDLPRDRILIEFPDKMAPGTHKIVIEVADRAGLAAEGEFQIEAVR